MLPTVDAIADAIATGSIPLNLAVELTDDNLAAVWSAEEAPRALIRLIYRICQGEVIIHRVVMPITRECVSAGGPVEREILEHLDAALADPETGLATVAEDRRRLTRLTARASLEVNRFLQLVVTLVHRFLDTGGILDIVTLLPSRSMAAGLMSDTLLGILRSVGPPTLGQIVAAAERVAELR